MNPSAAPSSPPAAAYRRPWPAPRPALLLAAYVGAAVAPLGMATLVRGREAPQALELAVGTGLVAMAMLLLQFISSGRHERVSGRAGLDKTLRFHQLAAYGLLLLALVHPLFFMLPSSLDELMELPGRLGSMAASPHLRSGVIALLALLALVPLAAWRTRMSLSYEIWRGAHVLLALVAAGAGLHHAWQVGGYSADVRLLAYWTLLAAAALGSLGYAWLVKPALLRRAGWRVGLNEVVGEDISRIVLEPAPGRALRYHAGQFIWVNFGHAFTLTDHPYSLASSPRAGPQLELLIKARGDFSNAACSIAVGTRAFVDGPHGDFVLEGRDGRRVALYAGGIGIAPILGILRDMQLGGDARPVRLLYGARKLERLAGRDSIDAMAREMQLEAQYVLETPPPHWPGLRGGFTPERVLALLRDWDPADTLCLACGPTPMMLAVERILLGAGVPARNIVFERFDYD